MEVSQSRCVGVGGLLGEDQADRNVERAAGEKACGGGSSRLRGASRAGDGMGGTVLGDCPRNPAFRVPKGVGGLPSDFSRLEWQGPAAP